MKRFQSFFRLRVPPVTARLFPRRRPRYRLSRSGLFWPALLPFLVLSGILANGIVFSSFAFAGTMAQPSTTPGHLTYQQFLQENRQLGPKQKPFVRPVNDPHALPVPKNVPAGPITA